MLTLQQMRYFLAIVKWQGFSRAAEALYVSQPALSKQISQMERSLQFTLFERTTRGISLTAKGEQLYHRIAPIIQDLDLALNDLTHPHEIRVGTLPSIASYLLPFLSASMESHKLKPSVMNTSGELLNAMRNGQFEAVLVQNCGPIPGFKAHCLLEEPYLLAMPCGHRLANLASVPARELSKERVILQESPSDIRDGIRQALTSVGVDVNLSLAAPFSEALLSYTATGAGLCFLPSMMARRVVHKGIVFRPIDNPFFTRKIILMARSENVLNLFTNQPVPDVFSE